MIFEDFFSELDQREKLNALNDQLLNVNASTKFVRVVNQGHCYVTHSLAEHYGVVSYQLNISLIKNKIYIVTNYVFINNNDDGVAIELYNKGFLISDRGCEGASYAEFLQQMLNDFKEILNLK